MSETQTVFPQNYEQLPFFTRKMILDRDNYTCQTCKVKLVGSKLDIHHKVPVRKGGTNALDNLVTLCRKCHKTIEPPRKLKYAVKVTTGMSIKVTESTFNHLAKLGKYGDTMDEIIQSLLHPKEKKQKKEVTA